MYTPPPLPAELTAHRRGDRAIIRYRFEKFPESGPRRPFVILTAVYDSGERGAGRAAHRRIRAKEGFVNQPMPFNPKPPFRIYVAVETSNGSSTRTVRLPLR